MDTGNGFSTDGLSRRRLIQGGAGVFGVATLGGVGAGRASAAKPDWQPRPIPGGLAENFSPVPVDPVIHVLPPSIGFDVSTITDFKGVVGAAEIRGTATDGATTYDFDADMRFMKGQYITIDGQLRDAAFAFV
jgi:hypothetical protein